MEEEEVTEIKGKNKRQIKFKDTPVMSTYLVAFIVGDFDHVQGKTNKGINVRVFTPPEKKHQGEFALKVACDTLSYFAEYFGIDYPLTKCDMIAISEFAAGAMENWGLITYRETALLTDEKSTTTQKQRVAYVVAHELAHQWFGNLVTMEWWTDLWLNEGFATWVGNLAVNHLFPEWDIWTNFVSDYVSRAFKMDSLKNSHPIQVEVTDSGSINEIFDAISYCKGASIIRMLADYIGEKDFKQGLHNYLEKFKYKNARTCDLWEALGQSSGKPVAKVMKKWTGVMGFPVVSVAKSECGKKIELTQTQFYSSGEVDEKSEIWKIPIKISTDSSNPELASKEFPLFSYNNKRYKFDLEATKWIKVNSLQSSFYRTQYDKFFLDRLAVAVSSGQLPPVDRLGLQNDLFALSYSGRTTTDKALEFSLNYKNETEHAVWSDLLINLSSISSVWSSEPNYEQFKIYRRDLLSEIKKKLGWDQKEGEPSTHALLRSVVLSVLGASGDEEVIKEGLHRFEKYVEDPSSLAPDLTDVVWKIAIANGGEKEYNQLFKIFENATNNSDKVKALMILGSTKNEELLKRTLNLTLDTKYVRSQDSYAVLYGVASNPLGTQLAWEWFTTNWDAIFKQFGEGNFLLSSMISYATKFFTQKAKAKEVKKFFQNKTVPTAVRTIQQSIEVIRTNSAWLERDRKHVALFLKKYSK